MGEFFGASLSFVPEASASRAPPQVQPGLVHYAFVTGVCTGGASSGHRCASLGLAAAARQCPGWFLPTAWAVFSLCMLIDDVFQVFPAFGDSSLV